MSVAAIVLAGGRARRMGMPKHAVLLDGRTLLERALEAVHPLPTVVVGPHGLAATVAAHPLATLTRERPAFVGPVAAIAAALDELNRRHATDGGVVLLACDLARPVEAVELLLRTPIGSDADGIVLRDAGARVQWLCGLYRFGALRHAVERMRSESSLDSARVSTLFDGLSLQEVTDPDGLSFDIDTPADLLAAARKATG